MSPVYRPTTELCLKLFYTCFGMDLAAWRAAYAVLIVLMALSFFAIGWRITRSPLAGGIAGLLAAYHFHARFLYFSSGLIFDVLGVIAVAGFFFLYLAARSRGWKWGVATVVAFCVVLGVKETAIDALVFVAAYELVEDPSLFKRRVLLWALAAVGVVFCVSRVFDPNSLSHAPGYQMTVSWAVYWRHLRYFLDRAFFGLWPALLLIAVAGLRSPRVAIWSVACFLAGLLPVAFIPQRQLDAAAIPMIALAVLAGLSVEALCALSGKRLGPVLAGVCIAFILVAQGTPASRRAGLDWAPHDAAIAPAFSALDRLSPPPPGDAHIVVDSDPFGSYEWADLYLFRLYYRSLRLEVKRPDQVRPEQLRAFPWLHVRWSNGRWEWATKKSEYRRLSRFFG